MNQVLKSVAKAKKMMQDLTPLDIEYIERYLDSSRRNGRLYPCSSVPKGNADVIAGILEKCVQNDVMDGFSDILTLEISYDPITYPGLDPPKAGRPRVLLNLLNQQTGIFRPHEILRSQDVYILIPHLTTDDEKQARLNRELAEDKARTVGVTPQVLTQEIACSSCGKKIGFVNEEQRDDPNYRPTAASFCKVCHGYLCLACYPEPTTGLEVCPVCGVWHYTLQSLVEWKY